MRQWGMPMAGQSADLTQFAEVLVVGVRGFEGVEPLGKLWVNLMRDVLGDYLMRQSRISRRRR